MHPYADLSLKATRAMSSAAALIKKNCDEGMKDKEVTAQDTE